MQIEIKNQGLAGFARELLDNADVTSTVIAGGVALFLAYGLWTIGRAIHRANRVIRTKLERVEKKSAPSLAFQSAQPVAVDTVSQLSRHWQRVDKIAVGHISRSAEAHRAHVEAATLLDALDFEMASLLAEVSSISSYVAERTGRAPVEPTHLAPRKPEAHRPIAA